MGSLTSIGTVAAAADQFALNRDRSSGTSYFDVYNAKFFELVVGLCVNACVDVNGIRSLVPPTRAQVVSDCITKIYAL